MTNSPWPVYKKELMADNIQEDVFIFYSEAMTGIVAATTMIAPGEDHLLAWAKASDDTSGSPFPGDFLIPYWASKKSKLVPCLKTGCDVVDDICYL